jgi:NAD(P)H-hydrate epimerase
MCFADDSLPLLSARQHRRLDELAESLAGLSPLALMETASQRAAEAIRSDFPGAQRARVLVGPGNNGGDGLGVARWLCLWGWEIEWVAWPLARAASPAVKSMRRALEWCAVDQRSFEDPLQAGSLLIDAWLGTGLRRPLEWPLPDWIAGLKTRVDLAAAPVVALDLPRGLCCDADEPQGPFVPAARTYSFAGRKKILEAGHGGVVRYLSLGIPEGVYRGLMAEA